MQNYIIVNLCSHDRAFYLEVNDVFQKAIGNENRYFIIVGNFKPYIDVVLAEGKALPFCAFASCRETLRECVEEGERMIAFDCHEDNPVRASLRIYNELNVNVIVSLGNDGRYFKMNSNAPKAMIAMQLLDNGAKIFRYPENKEACYEDLVDELLNVDSITHSPFFKKNLPLALISDAIGENVTEQLKLVAGHMGIDMVVKKKDEALSNPGSFKAILSLYGVKDAAVTILYGLPFQYVNIERNFRSVIPFLADLVKYENKGEWS